VSRSRTSPTRRQAPRVFPDSTKRDFNYYTPAKRKQSRYEDVTVEVQPDPRHYLAQGWLYGFSDGRGGYPLDWTALKAWGSDRPEPERYPGSGGKGYDWPATGWHEFRDPNEEWELTFYRYNSNVVRQLNQNVDVARQSKAFDQWNPNWVRFVESNVGAWMHVDHGLGLYLFANANRRAPTNMHNNAISVNSMHRIRSAQDLALYNLTLTEEIEGFDGSRAPGGLEQRAGLAGRPRGRRAADRDRRLVRGHLRGQRRLRAAGRRAVPQPAGDARGAAQRRLRHPHDHRRGGVRLRRAGPALHDPAVPPAHQRPGVRRPQQGTPAGVAVDLDRAARSPPPARCSRCGRSPTPSRRASRTPGRGQEPFRRHPHRPEPGRTEGAGQ
jgi:hypothetical protein